MSDNEEVNEVAINNVASAYQCLGDGGICMGVVETIYNRKTTVSLEIGLSHFGQKIFTQIPVYKSTSTMLRAIANELDNLEITDPVYLNPIRTGITNEDGDFELEYKEGSVCYIEISDEDGSGYDAAQD